MNKTTSTQTLPESEPGETAEAACPWPAQVVIRIRDNGPGIPEAVQSRLFDPFFTTKPVGKGTGLGLSISYKIVVEKHKGLIKCFSKPGKGTEFWVQIPAAQSKEKQE